MPALQDFGGIVSGDSWPGLILPILINSSPMNLDGWAIEFDIYQSKTGSLLRTFSTESGNIAISVPASAGVLAVCVPAVTTGTGYTIAATPIVGIAFGPASYWYRCVFTNSVGQRTTFFEGNFVVVS
jgi:hypothetical protein